MTSPARTRLPLAIAIAGLAGYVDAIAFIYLGGYFVSFMSGNTTQSGVELAGGDLAAAGFGMAVIVAFVLGVVAGSVVNTPGSGHSGLVLAGVSGFIALAAALAGAPGVDPSEVTDAALRAVAPTALCLSFAMGAANTVFSGRGEPAGVTYMTGALVKIGEGIARSLRGGERTGWLRSLALWLGIAGGAVVGASVYAVAGSGALWIGAVAGLVLAGVVELTRMRQ